MSPEQVQGIPVTGQADQFSLAVMAYEALTGEKPFTAEYLPTLLYKTVREEPIPPTLLNPTLDAQVDVAMRRALAKKPEDRFPSCAEFIEALAEALNAAPGWTPLPRGASHYISTVGSQDKSPEPTIAHPIEETQAIHTPPTLTHVVPAPAADPVSKVSASSPTPSLSKEPPPKEKMEATVLLAHGDAVPWTASTQLPPPSESHLFRNVLVGGLLVLLGAGGFLAYQRRNAPPTPSVTQAPVSSDSSSLPTPQTIPPPPSADFAREA